MKKLILILITTLAILGALAFSPDSKAISLSSGSTNQVGKDKIINGSYYASGDKVSIKGHVKGDVFCAANTVDIVGRVDGDVLCAAKDLTVDGDIFGSLRLAGQSIQVGGNIEGAISLVGANITTDKSLKVTKDATIFASSSQLDGQFGRDIIATGSLVRYSAVTKRDLAIYSDNFTLAKEAKVLGDFDYTSSRKASDLAAEIGGKTTYHSSDKPDKGSQAGDFSAVAASVIMMVATLMTYPLILPRLAAKTSRHGQSDILYSVLVGISTLVGLPILAVFLMFTVIGIPAGVAALLGLVIVSLIGLGQGAVWLGNQVLAKSTPNILLQSLGGALLLAISVKLPVIGVIVAISWLVLGVGMVTRYSASNLFQKPNYIEPEAGASKQSSSKA